MSWDENSANHADEIKVIDRLEEWMRRWKPNIRIQHLPTPKDSEGNPVPFPDYKVWEGNVSTAYGEIKSRRGRYTLDYMRRFDPLIATDKLKMLAGYNRRGFKAQVAYMSSDDHLLFIKDVTQEWVDSLEDAPDHMCMTTNNGRDTRGKPYPQKLLPFKSFVEVK
jgi:hypothetical protein